jgi:nucleoside-diphosphate-sugar epimerase
MTRALVTGGAGYFGDLLVRKLQECAYEVRILDLHMPQESGSGVEFVQGDIRDSCVVSRSCRGIDLVYHNVAQVPLAKDKRLFWSVNRDGTRVLLEACAVEGVRKLIYTSSSAIYGVPRANPVTEETRPNPQEDYGRAKLAGEKLCWEYVSRGLEVTIIRPRTILGHGRLGIFQILFEWIYQGKNVPVLDDGKNVYQFVHADDLAKACILAGEAKGGQAYNCGARRYGTMRSALGALCEHAGTGSRVKSVPGWLVVPAMKTCSFLNLSPLGAYHSLMYGRSMYFDTSKARIELGWTPKYSNEEMLIESYEWYLQNRERVLARTEEASRHKSAVKKGALGILQRFL